MCLASLVSASPARAERITTYDYDKVGQLKKVTEPDASWVAYSYDAAHRLTDVADSWGNSVHYTLDAMGNRTAEDCVARSPAAMTPSIACKL